MFGLLKKMFSGGVNRWRSLQIYIPGTVRHMDRDSQGYANEGYMENGVVYRCVDIISKSVASIPVVVTDKNQKPLPDHPLQKLLDRPNPGQGYETYIQRLLAFKLITGNTYEEVLTDGGGTPTELWVWQPYQFKIIEPKMAGPLPGAYIWDDGVNKKSWEVDPIDGSSDLHHWKYFSPIDRWYGMSPVQAAAWSVDQHNSASRWNHNLLQNSASPSGTVTVEGNLNDEQRQSLQEDLEARYSGTNASGRPILLEGGASFSPYGMSPKDMDWLDGKNLSARDIAAVYGVPTQVIPIQGDQTFANYEQARLALWEDTVIPTAEEMLNEWRYWLLPKFPDGDRLEIHLDLDEIPALEPRRAERWKKAQDADFITPNEKRDLADYEPYEPADEDTDPADRLWLPSGMLPIEEAGDDLGAEDEFEDDENEDDNNRDSVDDDPDSSSQEGDEDG